jgi:putative spermidine/putrescine transport system substrate-binding protein
MIAAALLLPAAVQAQDPKGEITFAAYVGVFQDNYTAAVVEPFMKRFPAIKVRYFPVQNSAQMLGLLRAHKENPELDAVMLDISVARAGNTEGLFAPLDPAIVTNAADVHPMGQVADGFGPAVAFDHLVMLYNTELVKPAPTGLADFWNPAHKGQISLAAAPDIRAIALTIVLAQSLGADYKQSVDPAIKRLAALAPSVQTWEAKPDDYTLVANGTVKLAIGWNARGQLYSDTTQGKLGVLIPSEGSAFQTNTINLVNKSKNPAAAQTFINYTLSPEAQRSFAERMFYAPTNTKTQVGPAALARTAASPESMAKMLAIDWGYVGTVRDAWLNRWRREIISAR